MGEKLKKILVIEDEEDNLKVLSMALKSAGYIVFGATNGEDGIELFRQEKPDLVILDVMMPVMDGWEVLRRIKAGLRSRRVPVIMLTAKNTDKDKIKGYEYGADFYVTKPYNIKKLLPIIRDMLSK